MIVEQLPEEQSYVEAYDRLLRQNPQAMLDEAAAVLEQYAARGITTITGSGWPLRPLFLSRKRLEFLARTLYRGFDALRRHILEQLQRGEIDALCEQIPIPKELFSQLDFVSSLQSDNFLCVLRPDGFLLPDRFCLIEPNFGNGSMISNAYTEIIYDFFRQSSVFRALSWDVENQLDRPFRRLLGMIRKRLPAREGRHFVALFCHHWEHQVIQSWEPRVIQQLYLAQQIMTEEGIDTRIVYEDGFQLDAEGHTTLKEDGQRVDCVVQFTIGTSFMDEPARFQEDLTYLRGPSVGDVPLLKPIACVCIDKGTLPVLSTLEGWRERDEDGYFIDIPTTQYPQESDAVEIRTHREEYVLKKSFDGKDTHVGVSTPGRVWNRILARALQGKEYVLQRYQPMPRTIMPMCFDEKHIEWVPVRVELSPFLIDGQYAGAIARYAPDAEGLVMSPPPKDMGLTNVFGC